MQIPDYVMKNTTISDSAKILYGHILENHENGICIKDNTFFSACMGGSAERTIRRYVTELKNANLIALMNFGKVRNAIYILNKEDYTRTQKNEDNINFDNFVANLDKFVRSEDNITQTEQNSNPILKILYDIYNLVLVSYKNNNINLNNSARVRTREITYSNNSSVNKFSTYDNAGSNDRVRVYSYDDRRTYTNLLFRDFFKYYDSKEYKDLSPQSISYLDLMLNVGLEIVDTMIEAFNQAQTPEGFKFDRRVYDKDKLLDLYLNITSEEFMSIVNQVKSKEDIKTRSPYIMGAILMAGRKLNYKKTDELVRKGYPWNSYVFTDKTYQDIFYVMQQGIEKEKQFEAYKQERKQIKSG